MKPRLVLFILLIGFLISFPVFAQTSAQPADLVVLRDGQDEYQLGRHLEILRDASGELTFQDVSSAAYRDRFTLSQVETPNFGFQKAAYWVRFRIHNQAEQNRFWVLELNFINMHYVDLYLPSADGVSYLQKQSGVMRPYTSRDIPYHHLAFNIDISPGSEQTVYLRFQNDASMTLPLTLWSRDAYTGHMLMDQLVFGLFFGAMIIMALFNILLWPLIRQRSYLYLALFIISDLGSTLFYRGYIFQFVKFKSPRLVTSSLLVLLGLFIFFLLMFVRELLDLKTISPKIYRLANFYGGVLLLTVLVAPFGSYQLIGVTQLILGIILLLAIIVIALYFQWKGSRPARLLLFSWVPYILGGILFALARMGLISSTPFIENISDFSLIWMVAVWSLALADRVNTLKAESETANHQLGESESRYRRLVEIMNEGLGVSDENDRFYYVNPRLTEMLGYSTDEMIGHPVLEFFDEENHEIIKDQLTRRRLGEKQPYTLTWRRKDGSELPTLIAPAAVISPEGKFQRSIVVVTDISEQVKASQLLEQRVDERTRQLSTLLEVSQVVVGTLELEPLLEVILKELRLVIDFDGAAIISLEDRTLTTVNFPLKINHEKVDRLTQSISTSLQTSERIRNDEAIIITDIQADTPEGRNFRTIAAIVIDVTSTEMRAWLGIPLRVKDKLIGILSIHHHQPGYYTPGMAQLAHTFANQAAIAIENARLYHQAQSAAAAAERGRLARELHDSVTQALYSLTLYAEATRLALGSGKTEAAEKNLNEVLAIAREGMGDLRLLIFELRPPILEQEGLVGALQVRLEAVESRAGCHAEFSVEGESNLSPEVETELYWAVNEALNNVLKHARAKHVYVDLQFHNGTSRIIIRDDGVGFDATHLERMAGIGLKNITERINRIGGRLKIQSDHGQGTLFEVTVAARE